MCRGIVEIRKTEIDDLDIARLRYENVFDLEIAVDNIVTVAVFEG